ncbi:hypothetical protein SDJN02_17913, partial [Cucurbita argyrosperma subsp. argyrosperma]
MIMWFLLPLQELVCNVLNLNVTLVYDNACQYKFCHFIRFVH